VQVVSSLTTNVRFVRWVMMLVSTVSYSDYCMDVLGSLPVAIQARLNLSRLKQISSEYYLFRTYGVTFPVQHEVYCKACYLGFDKTCTAFIPSQH